MPSRRTVDALRAALGEAVRAERLSKDWSQEELAERASLNRSYVTDLENGNRTPNLGTLVSLAEALGMKASGLLAAGEARLARQR